jgi:hypothetical protein
VAANNGRMNPYQAKKRYTLFSGVVGHASSKTTEIYTKVSRKSIKKMRNLLDDMEI